MTKSDKPGPLKLPTNELHNKRLLVVNTGYKKKEFIFKRLKALGYTIVCLNSEKNWATSYVSDWIIANTFNHSESIREVKRYIKQNGHIDGVITFWEDDVLLTSKLVDHLKVHGISYHIASHIRNKFLFRSFCKEHGLPVPKFQQISNKSDLEQVKRRLAFPIVIKPSFGSLTTMVVRVDEQQDLEQVYNYVVQNLSTKLETSLHDGLEIFAEEYIDGDEVDIDMILQNGKVKCALVTDNFEKSRGKFFLDEGQRAPSNLPEHERETLITMAELVLEKFGIFNGCIHFEAKYSSRGPVPIEVNLRMGGDYVYAHMKEVWGVDLIELATNVAMGQFITPYRSLTPHSYIIGWDLTTQSSGILNDITIDSKLYKKPYFVQMQMYKELGDTVLVPPEGFETVGWVMVRGENPNDALDNLQDAKSRIKLGVTRFDYRSFAGKTERKNSTSSAVINKNLPHSINKQKNLIKLINKKQSNLTIGIAYNLYSSKNDLVEQELASVGKTIEAALQSRGYATHTLDFNNVSTAIQDLQQKKIDLVFNLCERINDLSTFEPHAAAIFDIFQIPYTGSSPFTLSSCIDKIHIKKLLDFHQIPTAKWDYAYHIEDIDLENMKYPMIVKPAHSDNSIGITHDSVVTTKDHLQKQVAYILQTFKQPALIEEYLTGDEYGVPIIGNTDDDLQVLPLKRTKFDKYPEDKWHIFDFQAKYEENERFEKEYLTIQHPPKKVNRKLLSLIGEMALDAYQIAGCKDYGRVDIKLDEHNNPHVLEINPNPSINKGDGLPNAAELIGLNYGDLIEKIISLAIARYRKENTHVIAF